MRLLLSSLLAAGCIAVCTPAGARAAAAAPAYGEIVVVSRHRPFAAPRVPERELAAMRGGLLLPNGFDVALGVDIQTRVDGVLVLHTIYASEGPASGIRVFTDGRDGAPLAPGTVVVSTPGSPGTAVVMPDRSPTGTTIAVTPGSGATIVNLVNSPQSTWLTAEGQNEVPVVANGPAITVGPGSFSQTVGAAGTIVMLDTGDLQIRHLVGQATGAVIANSANDRIVDTVASVNVDVSNLTPLLTASQFAADAMALRLVR